MRFKRLVSVLLTCAFIASPILVFMQHQNIYDWWSLRSYVAPASVEKLATDTSMTDKARKIFYVARPSLQEKQSFRSFCASAEKTIVLGCYKQGSGIYVYNVTDDRLNGVHEVTAAHEMLHAAYDRLSSSEQTRIDHLTTAFYNGLTDERIKKNVEAYRSRDASVVPNELHSILATEVKVLTPELEAYYKQYFTNRQKVVSYSDQYEAEFSKRSDLVESYDVQLKSIKAEIDAYNESLTRQATVIDAESARLDSLRNSDNIPAYNAGIPNYKRLISNYNSDLSRLKAKISTYNLIIEQRNSVVSEEQELFNAIDTRVPGAK